MKHNKKNILIVCDVQQDVVQKLPKHQQQLCVDLISLAIQAARQRQRPSTTTSNTLYTMLKFDNGYKEIPPSHPRLGVLPRMYEKNPNLAPKWFTSSELCIEPLVDDNQEKVVTRTTFLPHASDPKLIEALRAWANGPVSGEHEHVQHECNYTVVGYGPTVQAVCHIVGDVLASSKIHIIQECIFDENTDRCHAFLTHGLLFNEDAISITDFLESMDLLHERIDFPVTTTTSTNNTSTAKYVCDCGRGGHLSLFLPYLLRDYNYTLWPTQPWYQELTATNKQYHCPLGKRVVNLCDEPQFSANTKFFLSGRQYLDEKNLLYELVGPELMPPTFETVELAQQYANTQTDSNNKLIWFLKKVNQNGGRAVTVINELPAKPLEKDEQLQAHVPRPLLYHEHRQKSQSQLPQSQEGKFKCHVKTYQYIACTTTGSNGYKWQLYMHDLFYLATASRPWNTDDLSDEAQITTMRTHRLYPENSWRMKWKLTETCRSNMITVLRRAIEQGKLQTKHSTVLSSSQASKQEESSCVNPQQQQHNPDAALQFEINSADWMLDEDGRMYLIECNGIPVLYDAGMPQDLVTKGLKLYDKLYKEDPEGAVVNDHDLLQDAIGLALTGKLPKSSLWKHVATVPDCINKLVS